MTIAILGLGEDGSRFANDLEKRGVKIVGFDPNLKRALEPSVVVA
jgi:3-hydroxyisobutyrate dehydrogenase-like beta-hydroxyacid dehydrogenase